MNARKSPGRSSKPTPGAAATYRPDIDGLRAVAVLSVVAFHAFPTRLPGGFIGVDIFFVISGYLISGIIMEKLDRGAFSLKDFYGRRIRRIFPALGLVLCAVFAFGWFALLSDEFKQLGKHIAAGAGFVANLVFWSEAGYFDNSAATKPLIHLWSLGVEEQFYILWPAILWIAYRRRASIPFLVAFMAIASLAVGLKVIRTDAVAAFYSPLTRFWELFSGGLLAWATLHGASAVAMAGERFSRWRAVPPPGGATAAESPIPSLASLLGLLLLFYGFVKINKDMPFPGALAVIPVLGAVLVISSGPGAWLNRRLLANRIAVWFGLISFPLYLWHWPLLSFATIAGDGAPSGFVRICLVLVAVVLAWLTYEFVEKPLRWGGRGGAKAAALAMFMAAIGSIGYLTYARDGLPGRYSGEIRALQEGPKFSFTRFETPRSCTPFPGAKDLQLCEETQRPLIFLMGDSHAGKLYFGLNALQRDDRFGIVTATGCGNVPYLVPDQYGDDKWCDSSQTRFAFNRSALERIGQLKPELVILHARWAYVHYRTDIHATVEKLRETVRQISARSPESQIVVVGPVPNWKSTPARELVKHARLDGHVAYRLKVGLVDEIKDWDNVMASELTASGIHYISAYRAMCNADGCLARVGDAASDVTAADYGHLSPAGSQFLVQTIRDRLFSLLGRLPDKRTAP